MSPSHSLSVFLPSSLDLSRLLLRVSLTFRPSLVSLNRKMLSCLSLRFVFRLLQPQMLPSLFPYSGVSVLRLPDACRGSAYLFRVHDDLGGNVAGAGKELGTVAVHKGRVATAFVLAEDVQLRLKLAVRLDGARRTHDLQVDK